MQADSATLFGAPLSDTFLQRRQLATSRSSPSC